MLKRKGMRRAKESEKRRRKEMDKCSGIGLEDIEFFLCAMLSREDNEVDDRKKKPNDHTVNQPSHLPRSRPYLLLDQKN